MGRLFLRTLEGRIYSCKFCHTHLANFSNLVSKGFQGRQGNAYLFGDVANVYLGRSEDKVMITGLHTVADVTCNACDRVLGWKYLVAHEENQKYKEGLFVIERTKIDFGDWSQIENLTDVAPPIDSEGEA